MTKWRLVPVEPTNDMLLAPNITTKQYKWLLAAAPEAPRLMDAEILLANVFVEDAALGQELKILAHPDDLIWFARAIEARVRGDSNG